MSLRRIAVLVSGRGSNLRALVEHLDARGGLRSADVVLVASDRVDAGALAFARERGLPAEAVAMDDTHERSLGALLHHAAIDLVVLAGYVRRVPPSIVRDFAGRIVNVHPALLPSFGGAGMYGARVHRAVLDAGARLSGPTVHFVTDEYDRGAIIAQWPVPVFVGDNVERLAARVLRAEHALYPRTVDALAAGRVSLAPDGRVVGGLDLAAEDVAFTLVTDEETDSAHSIDQLFAH
ncbi:MAG: phosphoribosylglycinamide formyltransferase [Gemmatimonadaceae bacterium]